MWASIYAIDGISNLRDWWDLQFTRLTGSLIYVIDGISNIRDRWDLQFTWSMGPPIYAIDGISNLRDRWDLQFTRLMGSPIYMIDGWWASCSVSIGKIHFVRMLVHDDSAGNLKQKKIPVYLMYYCKIPAWLVWQIVSGRCYKVRQLLDFTKTMGGVTWNYLDNKHKR
jgi:hypothetical protein